MGSLTRLWHRSIATPHGDALVFPLRIAAFVAGLVTLAATQSIWPALGVWFAIEPIVLVLEHRKQVRGA